MKKKHSHPLSEFQSRFTVMFKKWMARKGLNATAICSLALHEHIPSSADGRFITDQEPITLLQIQTTEMNSGDPDSIEFHARALRKSLDESYGHYE